MDNLQANNLIKHLYQAVDNKDIKYLENLLGNDVQFRIGNYDTIVGKAAALVANQQFFDSISSMSHTIDRVWSLGDDIICNGLVNYVRLGGTKYQANFSTILTMKNDNIAKYFVYADISQL